MKLEMAKVKSMIDIATLSKEEMQTFLDSFDTIITDCDGVLWLFGIPISGSPATIKKLISLGKKVILMTNNATIHIDRYLKICQALDMPIPEEDIFTPATGIVRFLKSQDLVSKQVFVIGPQALVTYLKQKDVQCCETGVDTIPEDIGMVHAELDRLCPNVGAVVLDTDINLSYLKIMRAAMYLRNPDCVFVVGATDKDICVRNEDHIPGPGYFAAVLEEHSGRTPTIVGKPSTYMADAIVKERSLDRSRVLFIGDTLVQDISLGRAAGFQTLLVLSGISKLADVNESNMPDYYVRTLSDLLTLLPEVRD